MLPAISKIIECIHIPYVIMILASFYCIRGKSGKRLILFIAVAIFMFLWRSFFTISSRYCCAFLIYALFAICFGFDTIIQRISFLFLATLTLLTINSIEIYTSFRNLYIYDVHDSFDRIEKQSLQDSPKLIRDKEALRIGRNLSNVRAFDSIEDVLGQYSLYGNTVFLFDNNQEKVFKESNTYGITSKIISQFISSHKKKRCYVFLSLPHTNPHVDFKKELDKKTNLIVNGSFEKMLDASTAEQRLTKWLVSPFYESKLNRIPYYKNLLPTWSKFEDNATPLVYADERNAISGSYSLNVRFPKNNKLSIYFLNQIKAFPGTLYFNIRNLGSPGEIRIARNDYSNGKQTVKLSNSSYYIYLNDNDIHTYKIEVSQDSFRGDSFLFHIFGRDINFLMDDLFFIRQDN